MDHNRIKWDCHMHSSFSADSDAPLSAMIRSAKQKGLSGICITEHLDPDFPATPEEIDFSLDLPEYLKAVRSAKASETSGFSVLLGLEAGLQPHLGDFFRKLLSEYPFDFVIGSSHIVHHCDPYYPEFWKGRDEQECIREYFRSILENVSAFSDFDVYGHIDYILRYGPTKNRNFTYEAFADCLDPILLLLLEKGIGLELNTAGYHYGLEQPNPCMEILKRYKDLGGEIITIGSDAHEPERISADFDRAANVLLNCGFRHYTVFKNRRPVLYPL